MRRDFPADENRSGGGLSDRAAEEGDGIIA
jgi:hypothetical protein